MLSKSIMTNTYYHNGKEITEVEYNEILGIIRNKPNAPDGYDYRLNDFMEWELYEMPTVEHIEELPEVETI